MDVAVEEGIDQNSDWEDKRATKMEQFGCQMIGIRWLFIEYVKIK